MSFRYNTSGVPERTGGFTLVDEDTYHVIVDGIKEMWKGDDPQVVVTYRIIAGEQTDRTFEGKTLKEWRTFKPDKEQKGWNKHFLKVLGQPWDGDIAIDPDAWVGHQLLVVVKHNTKDDRTYANVIAHDPLLEPEAQVSPLIYAPESGPQVPPLTNAQREAMSAPTADDAAEW